MLVEWNVRNDLCNVPHLNHALYMAAALLLSVTDAAEEVFSAFPYR